MRLSILDYCQTSAPGSINLAKQGGLWNVIEVGASIRSFAGHLATNAYTCRWVPMNPGHLSTCLTQANLKNEYEQAVFQRAGSAASPRNDVLGKSSIKGKEDEGPICELRLI